jgi:hypothetical protein
MLEADLVVFRVNVGLSFVGLGSGSTTSDRAGLRCCDLRDGGMMPDSD